MALTDVSGPLTWCWSTVSSISTRRRPCSTGWEESPRGTCGAPCVLGERAGTLLAGLDGRIHPRLRPVFDAPIAARRPQSVIYWLSHSAGPSAPPPGLRRHRDIPRRVRPAASTQGHSLHPRAARHARRPPGVQRSPRAAHPFAQRHRRPAPRRARRHRRPVCPLAGSAQAAPAG